MTDTGGCKAFNNLDFKCRGDNFLFKLKTVPGPHFRKDDFFRKFSYHRRILN